MTIDDLLGKQVTIHSLDHHGVVQVDGYLHKDNDAYTFTDVPDNAISYDLTWSIRAHEIIAIDGNRIYHSNIDGIVAEQKALIQQAIYRDSKKYDRITYGE